MRRASTHTGEQRRISAAAAEPRGATDTGGLARADSSEFRRIMDARAMDAHTREPRPTDLRRPEGRGGDARGFDSRDPDGLGLDSRGSDGVGLDGRGSDTGEFRRFLEAGDRPAETGEQRRVAVAAPAAPPRQSRAVTVGIVMLSLIVLVAGGVVGVAYFTGTDDRLDDVLQLGASGKSGERVVTAPLDNRSQASFEVLAATNRVNVSIGELGDDLYRISTPEDAGIRPDPVITQDDVKLQVTKDGGGTGGEIDIVLAAKVRWALRFSGYAEEQVINVTGGQISGLELVGGMRTAQINLARPTGTVPIKVNGAVEKLVVSSPTGSPVRIKVGGGVKTVVAGNRTLKDVAPGSTLTPKNWAVPNRYDMGAGAPISALTIENG
ncbi:hypothetical protein [Paractinoplanes brasiliensis]|uniref:Uncharacterized protein n=1 Tax=Paractinoplanes brasiliensis TaxID=52695 RepID=A0A4R6JQI9_9ACTN|nr:hypothetical protein [Actinoplanes brasiliensis]TDO38257.1 hypothetical protein C8E87_1907 [Actinoplanes brasiliensis]GID26966.1 hypothetical protein Abr02nite_19490 [Actinoplanes brasiliensis]